VTSRPDTDLRAENERLSAAVIELQNQRVDEWVRLIRYGAVVPRSIEDSLSWKLTRPVRLAQTATRVLRRDGLHTFAATVRARLRRNA